MTARCMHYECLCARAEELAAVGQTAEAVALHRSGQLVPCRRSGPSALFGDGRDGRALFDGGEVAGARLLGDGRTYALTRDAHYDSIDFAGEYVLALDGYRLQVRGGPPVEMSRIRFNSRGRSGRA